MQISIDRCNNIFILIFAEIEFSLSFFTFTWAFRTAVITASPLLSFCGETSVPAQCFPGTVIVLSSLLSSRLASTWQPGYITHTAGGPHSPAGWSLHLLRRGAARPVLHPARHPGRAPLPAEAPAAPARSLGERGARTGGDGGPLLLHPARPRGASAAAGQGWQAGLAQQRWYPPTITCV